MNRKLIGVLTSAIVVVCLLVHFVPDIVLDSLLEGAPAWWIPTFGTAGQTVVLYSLVVETLVALTPISLGIAFGYMLDQRRSPDVEFRSFVRTVAVGATAPVLVAWIVAIGLLLVGPIDAYSIVLRTAFTLNIFVSTSIPVFVATFAGATFSMWSRDGFPWARHDRDGSVTGPATK